MPGLQPRRGRGHRGGLGEREHARRAEHRDVTRAQRLRGVGVGHGQLDAGGEPGSQPRAGSSRSRAASGGRGDRSPAEASGRSHSWQPTGSATVATMSGTARPHRRRRSPSGCGALGAGHGAHRRRASPPTPGSPTSAGRTASGPGIRTRRGCSRSTAYLADPEVRRRAWRSRRDHAAWTARAERRPPRARRPRARRPPARDRHPEHRRPAPAGRQSTGPGHRDPRHDLRGRVPGLRRPRADAARRSTGCEAGEEDPPCRRCGGILKSATISFGQGLDPATLRRAVTAGRASPTCCSPSAPRLQVHPVAGLVDLALRAGRPGGDHQRRADAVRRRGRRGAARADQRRAARPRRRRGIRGDGTCRRAAPLAGERLGLLQEAAGRQEIGEVASGGRRRRARSCAAPVGAALGCSSAVPRPPPRRQPLAEQTRRSPPSSVTAEVCQAQRSIRQKGRSRARPAKSAASDHGGSHSPTEQMLVGAAAAVPAQRG